MAALLKSGEAVAVGVDIRDGYVAIHGWTENSALHYTDFMAKLTEFGVQTVIVTDISRDGAMIGTNRDLYRHLYHKDDRAAYIKGVYKRIFNSTFLQKEEKCIENNDEKDGFLVQEKALNGLEHRF